LIDLQVSTLSVIVCVCVLDPCRIIFAVSSR